MTHYLRSEDNEFKFKVEMGCGHPKMENNSTDSVGCDGDCGKCNHGIATTTIPKMMELLRRANCEYKV